jgi:hypothetical protein
MTSTPDDDVVVQVPDDKPTRVEPVPDVPNVQQPDQDDDARND